MYLTCTAYTRRIAQPNLPVKLTGNFLLNYISNETTISNFVATVKYNDLTYPVVSSYED